MNSMDCFDNESEICFYLDGELSRVREAALDHHIGICGRCSDQVLIWKQIRGLVHDSISDVKAPVYFKDRIISSITASAGEESDDLRKGIKEDSQISPGYPINYERPSKPYDVNPLFPAFPNIPIRAGESDKHSPNQHLDKP